MNLLDLRPVPIRTVKEAQAVCGTLSKPSKMPGYAFSLSAEKCNVGSTLRGVKGSTCAKCYALKGNYRFPAVKKAQAFRMAQLYHPQWVDAMVHLIDSTATNYFRWHDAGDLMSLAHLINIVRVAEQLPEVHFWLPTREKALVHSYTEAIGPFPKNLVVRISAAMVGGDAPPGLGSTVYRRGDQPPVDQHGCPAHRQGNACGRCRACWDPAVRTVSYLEH